VRIKIDLDRETANALTRDALANERPVALHAKVLLRLALGLPFPVQWRGERVANSAEAGVRIQQESSEVGDDENE